MSNDTPPVVLDTRFRSPKYLLKRQIFKMIGSNFFIYDASGQLALFVHQQGFKLKEAIQIYADEGKSRLLMSIAARTILDFSAAYDVFDETTGQKIGMLKRKGWNSIVRDEWIVCDPFDREIGTLIEDQLLFALLRRLLSNLIPQNYDLLINGQRVVDVRQNFNPFTYHLNIEFTPAQGATVDPRLALAAGILLAAIEGRQS